MKTYWDASALIEAAGNASLRQRLAAGGGVTRTHTLAEVFSTLTGGRADGRVSADKAASIVAQLSADLDFEELTSPETLRALSHAESKGVRGGRVYDYLHAVTAHKAKAAILLTSDKHGFDGLFPAVELL